MNTLVQSIEDFRSLDEGFGSRLALHAKRAVSHLHPASVARGAGRAASDAWRRIKRAGRVVRHGNSFGVAHPPHPEDYHSTKPTLRVRPHGEAPKPGGGEEPNPYTTRPGAPRPAPHIVVQPKPAAPAAPRPAAPAQPEKPKSAFKHVNFYQWKPPEKPKPKGPKMDIKSNVKKLSKLRESIEAFRSIDEAKVGDYVTTVDGRGGYVQSAAGGKLAVRVTNQSANKTGTTIYVDAKDVTTNPGGKVE